MNKIAFEKMSEHELTYMEGFISKCSSAGVDPEAVLEKRAQFLSGIGNVGKGLGQKAMGYQGYVNPAVQIPRAAMGGWAAAKGLWQGGAGQARKAWDQSLAATSPQHWINAGNKTVDQGLGQMNKGYMGSGYTSAGRGLGSALQRGVQGVRNMFSNAPEQAARMEGATAGMRAVRHAQQGQPQVAGQPQKPPGAGTRTTTTVAGDPNLMNNPKVQNVLQNNPAQQAMQGAPIQLPSPRMPGGTAAAARWSR